MNKYWKSSLLLPILLQASISSAIEHKTNVNDLQNVELNMQKNRKGSLQDSHLASVSISSSNLPIANISNIKAQNPAQIFNYNTFSPQYINQNNILNYSTLSLNNSDYIASSMMFNNSYFSSNNENNNTINEAILFANLDNSPFFILQVLTTFLFLIIVSKFLTKQFSRYYFSSFWRQQLNIFINKTQHLIKHYEFKRFYLCLNIRKIECSTFFKNILLSQPIKSI